MNQVDNTPQNTTIIFEEHFRKEAIIAESKITEKINKALEDPETAGRRWFWELLQNAKDTVAFNPNKPEQPYKNVKDKSVDVILTYSQDGERYFLTFEHNGNPFHYADDLYRFDDVTNLILPVSGKDSEYQTGKFGTGFLSTHILALKIGVEGVFLNKDEQLKDFNFIIDRTKFTTSNANTELRKEFIESIVETLKRSVEYTEHKNTIKTKFTYYLNDNIKQDIKWVKQCVEEGLNDLDVLLPLVLCFNESIKSVTINNQVANLQTCYQLNSPRTRLSDQINLFHVSINKNNEPLNILLCDDESIQLATYFDTDSGSNTNFFINLNELYKTKTGKRMPFLFSSLPLIGSEEFTFPTVINSKKFRPKETRDSISLKNNDSGNQTIIEDAAKVYKKLLKDIANDKWKKTYNISDTHIALTSNHKWISDEWHKTRINPTLRESILHEKLIDIPTNKEQTDFIRKSIKENDNLLHFPVDTKKEILWKYAMDLFPEAVPSLGEVSEWNRILWDNEKDFKKVNAEFLVKKISEYRKDFKPLANQIFGESESAVNNFIDWLYDFIKFIVHDLKQGNLLDIKSQKESYPILPTRKGEFKLLSELNYDKGFFDNDSIEDKTLILYTEFCGKNVIGELLLKRFDDLNLLPQGRETKEKDLASKICETVNQKIREGKISNIDKTSLSELRNFLFNIRQETIDEADILKKRIKEKYEKMFSALDLDKIFLSVVEQDKISSVTKLLESDRNGTINIKKFEELAENPKILSIAEKLLNQQLEDNLDFKVKKEIGNIFEKYFRDEVKSYDFLSVKKVEGEEDFEVFNSNTKKTFYVEIKSATNAKTYVELTPDQGRAFSTKENYILCIIPDSNLVKDEVSFLDKAIFNRRIGHQLKDKVQTVADFEKEENGIEIIFETELLSSYKKYRYKYRIKDQLWGCEKFNNFLEWLSE